METIAQFNSADVQSALVDFTPARVQVSGKTTTDKRLSVVNTASEATKMFLSNMKGKVGDAARGGLQEQGFNMIATAAARGNYRPLAEALATLQAENINITTRASFESLTDRFDAKMEQLEAEGKKYNKGGDKFSSKYAIYAQCVALVSGVQLAVAEFFKAQKDQAQ